MLPVVLMCIGVFGDQEGTVRPLTTRMAVIAAGKQSDVSIKTWARSLQIPYFIQRDPGSVSHNIGESILWCKFISEHYHQLPDYVVLLDDAGPHSWHVQDSRQWLRTIKTYATGNFMPLGKILGDKNMRDVYLRSSGNYHGWDHVTEWDCAFHILRIFNVTYDARKHSPVCCANAVVSKRAIMSHPQSAYARLYDLIRKHPSKSPYCQSGRWGYAFERLQGILFT